MDHEDMLEASGAFAEIDDDRPEQFTKEYEEWLDDLYKKERAKRAQNPPKVRF
jgi:hypothetical protein